MASGRSAKRARKKDRRNARRDEWRKIVQKRRRQRWGIFLGSLGVAGVGLLVAFVAFDRSPQTPKTTPGSDTITAAVKEPVACGAKVPAAAGSKKLQYAKAEDQKLDPDKSYVLNLTTSCGNISIELDVERAPKTANSVTFLARQQFYDGLVFHRINESFVIQGGDPVGDGSGGSGYDVVEPPPDDLKYEEGIVAMAKGGTDPAGTSGSQFFIVSGDEGEVLPPEYALLGKVIDGMDVVREIEKLGATEDGPPEQWTYIERANVALNVLAKN